MVDDDASSSPWDIPFSTHRVTSGNEPPFFPHELLIAAISIAFCRYTVRMRRNESPLFRLILAGLLGSLAYVGKCSYQTIIAAELFSYAGSWWIDRPVGDAKQGNGTTTLMKILYVGSSAAVSVLVGHLLCSSLLWRCVGFLTPAILVRGFEYLFPVRELIQAWGIMNDLTLEPDILRHMVNHLFFVTFHTQVGIGYLGIQFLHKQQERKNQLIRLDVPETSEEKSEGKREGRSGNVLVERAQKFKRGAAPFIFGVALPYMIQIILMGNINKYAFVCLANDMHSMIRFRQVFEQSNNLASLASNSTTTPEAYADSMSMVVTTSYDLFNRKLFSLPKILLLPQIFARQPLLLVQAFPFIFLSDWIKASAMAYLTTVIESLQQELKDLKGVRSKVESFDIKNADLLQRSGTGASTFTKTKWEELTAKVQTKSVISDLLTRSKTFFSFIQHHFVFVILIDCALADMIALGKMGPSEIFVYSRAIEDAIDLILMRSRNEAELARMQTEIERLEIFREVVDSEAEPRLLPCRIDTTQHSLLLGSVHYSRGLAEANAFNVTLSPGVYALTGANGSGKSTLFRVLMSCASNEHPVDLPASIIMKSPIEPEMICRSPTEGEDDDEGETCEANDIVDPLAFSITMPSAEVIEISQSFYWPLHAKPIDWISQGSVSAEKLAKGDQIVNRVAEELFSLEFFQANSNEADADANGNTADAIAHIVDELEAEKDDWFSELSGGQKSKVELVRLVFLRERCPDVVLIDETFAPLDPVSKQLVMEKLKSFCGMSIILVIYHADIDTDGSTSDCIASANFFDKNIHLNDGKVQIKDTCESNKL